MPIKTDNNESVKQVTPQARSKLRELTYNLYSRPGGAENLPPGGSFAEVLAAKMEPRAAEPSAWDKGYTVDRGVSYTASRVLDEQLQGLTKVNVNPLRTGDPYGVKQRDRGQPPDTGPENKTGQTGRNLRTGVSFLV